MEDLHLIRSTIKEQNPWWKNSTLPRHFVPPTERALAKFLWKHILSAHFNRHVVILGPRRVGKTTVMYQTVRHLLKNNIQPEKIQWIRLDHPVLMSVDLGTLVRDAIKLSQATLKDPLYLFLDELIYADKWNLWLKTFYDEHWPVRIVASSSATAALQKGKESGVGRWEEIYLTPYFLKELLQLYEKDPVPLSLRTKKECLYDIIKYLVKSFSHTSMNFYKERRQVISFGGFPEFLTETRKQYNLLLKSLKNEDKITIKKKLLDMENSYFYRTQQTLRSDAIERAIYKDIPQSYRVDNPLILEKLLYTLAEQITGLLSVKNINKDISQVSLATLERYLNYLCQAYIVFTLPNYASNERSIQRRQRKSYFVDIAVRNAALWKDKKKIFDNSLEFGKLQENLVASHLHYLGKQTGIRLYHWRRGKYEVDLIYDDPVQPLALEIGTSAKHSYSGFKKFLMENPKFKNRCYYVAPDLQFFSAKESPSGVGRLPLDLLLMAIGLNQEQSLALFMEHTEQTNL